jgi:hypothetical protein|tara:strand:- start:248 stop:454 length:207 start_codon:yes stop_codon:yes gene_type:complete
MSVCSFCEIEEKEFWGSSFCKTCSSIKNIAKVYSFEKSLEILRKVCLRNETQLENNIKRELENNIKQN